MDFTKFVTHVGKLMDVDQKIQNAANDFQNTIYDLLKQVVDEGILFSESNQYDEVDTFLYVINL